MSPEHTGAGTSVHVCTAHNSLAEKHAPSRHTSPSPHDSMLWVYEQSPVNGSHVPGVRHVTRLSAP
jgi:hypothetical protein